MSNKVTEFAKRKEKCRRKKTNEGNGKKKLPDA